MHKANAVLNGEWAKHVGRAVKKATAKKRRAAGKKVVSCQRREEGL